MNMKQLEYFVCVAENLNFTKAAKKCFISQTAMTQQIKALEENVGVELFVRDKHHVELTPAGRVYLTEARDILDRSDKAMKRARSAAEGFSGSLRIGFIRGFEKSAISKTIRDFHEDFPNISTNFLRDNMSSLYAALEDGACDLAFNLSPYVQSYPRLHHHFLKSYPVLAILYPGHPLSNREYITYKDLEHEDFIIMQPLGRADEEDEEVVICFNRGGFVPNIIGREPEIETQLLMVSVGLGICIQPEYSVRFFSDAENLVLIPIKSPGGEDETLDFELCWDESNDNPALGRFLEWLG